MFLGQVAELLVRHMLPTLTVAGLLVLGAAGWDYLAPSAPRDSIEAVIVNTQRARAAAAPPADLLITGDSSALMDVDAAVLNEDLRPRTVESLALIGIAGPAAFGRLIEQYRSAGGHIGTVILLVHGETLASTDQDFAAAGYESAILNDEAATQPARRPSNLLAAARDKLFHGTLAQLVDYPLPGAYGRMYGWSASLEAALRAGHGTLLDPNEQLSPTADQLQPFRFAVSPDIARRLSTLGHILGKVRAEHVLIGITPILTSQDDPGAVTTRRAALAEIARQLQLDRVELLPLPSSRPDSEFATRTHLNAKGREEYTRLLAGILSCLHARGRHTGIVESTNDCSS